MLTIYFDFIVSYQKAVKFFQGFRIRYDIYRIRIQPLRTNQIRIQPFKTSWIRIHDFQDRIRILKIHIYFMMILIRNCLPFSFFDLP